jgi:catechol 2,3-dioxygenase-like lactoylglutathione lyase family enzyme
MLSSPDLNTTLVPGHLRRVHHIALNVHDLQASRHFYGAILGLHELTGEEVPTTLRSLVAEGKVTNFVTPDGTVLDLFWEPELPPRGKTSVDWFFGFKLHLVVNEQGELLNALLTPGNTDDRTPVPQLLQRLFGKVFGDRGYVSQKLALQLWQDLGIQLITKLKRNMKNRLMALSDKLLLRRRAIIESVIDQLKNISQIEHSRHRSPVNCLVNLVCGLIAYCHQPTPFPL